VKSFDQKGRKTMTNDVRRVYRSRDERMLGGVCGGLAAYFTMDPTLIRVLFILLSLFGGHGVLAYLVLLILIPIEPQPVSPTDAG
jgi:phage shock protein C